MAAPRPSYHHLYCLLWYEITTCLSCVYLSDKIYLVSDSGSSLFKLFNHNQIELFNNEIILMIIEKNYLKTTKS